MSYQRTTWVTETTPVSAANMNNIEDGVEEALDGVNDIKDNFASLFLDVFYPVGSYFETSKSEFNPGAAWGGTWVLETPGMVHVSGGTGYAVSKADNASGAGEQDGGNKDAIVPYHRHSIPALSGTASSTGSKHTHTVNASLPMKTAMSNGTWSTETIGGISGTGFHIPQTLQSDTFTFSNSVTASIASSGEHSHPVSTTADNTGYAGESGNLANANMQPYINVYRWHRTG